MANGNYFVHTLLRARDWQHRPEFDRVCDWWRGGGVGIQPVMPDQGRGVCALVGMGGAGKTAIADRFLNELLAQNTSTTRERVSPPPPPPRSVFVYSFYDDDKPENFFRHLQIWLEGSPNLEKELSVTQIMFLIQQHRGLMILDGLEKVQESGARGGFGKLTSPSLRDLLNHIACGAARELSVLVTSRFPLTDLRDSQPRFFHTIAVDQIEVAAGVQLLRDRGVCGTDVQLVSVVEHCGRHALTIDLAGGYIKEYGNGDPTTPLNLGTAKELQTELEDELDEQKRAVLLQKIRFARIAQRYREAMLGSDEAALALLERICLFRLGVDCETLAAIFTGPDAEKVSGEALAGLDIDQLQRKLDWLERMRIAEKAKSSAPNTGITKVLYNIHSAVRAGFRSGIRPGDAAACHAVICEHYEASLPSDLENHEDRLDDAEELIYHLLEQSRWDDAFAIYNRIGGYRRLDYELYQYSRGERITRMLSAQKQEPPSADYCRAINDHAGFWRQLGDLERSWCSFQRVLDTARDTGPDSEWQIAQRNQLIIGNLRGFSKRVSKTAILSSKSSDATKLIVAIERAKAEGVTGELSSALSRFNETVSCANKLADSGIRKAFATIWLSELMACLGKARVLEASKLLSEITLTNHRRNRWPTIHAWVNYAQANLSLVAGDFRGCRESLSHLEEWTKDSEDIWATIVAGITRARLYCAELSREMCPNDAGELRKIDVALQLARNGGFGLYHIDLLLERARLRLLRGDPGAALADIELALDTGIPANEETGQPELLAANHEECGYAWPIPFGLQLRAEALLLQAAQTIGSAELGRNLIQPTLTRWHLKLLRLAETKSIRGRLRELCSGEAVESPWLPRLVGPRSPSELQLLEMLRRLELLGYLRKDEEPDPNDWSDWIICWSLTSDGSRLVKRADGQGVDSAQVRDLIAHARENLIKSLDRWHDLRDPEPAENNNFKLDGKEYNYRAAETHQLLVQLEGGMLTRYPLARINESEDQQEDQGRRKPRTGPSQQAAPSAAGHHKSADASRIPPPGWTEVEAPTTLEEFLKWLTEQIATLRKAERRVTDDELLAEMGQPRTHENDWPLAPSAARRPLLVGSAYRIVTSAHRWLEYHGYSDQPDRPKPFDNFDTADRELSKLLKFLRTQQRHGTPVSPALQIWKEKLEYLQQQEAIASDPAQKFTLMKQIEEAKQKILELGGDENEPGGGIGKLIDDLAVARQDPEFLSSITGELLWRMSHKSQLKHLDLTDAYSWESLRGIITDVDKYIVRAIHERLPGSKDRIAIDGAALLVDGIAEMLIQDSAVSVEFVHELCQAVFSETKTPIRLTTDQASRLFDEGHVHHRVAIEELLHDIYTKLPPEPQT